MTAVPLRAVADVLVSNVDKKTSDGQVEVRLCNYTDVYYNRRITADMEFMEATATRDQVTKFALRAGDVVLTKDSEDPADIAVPTFVVSSAPDLVCGYHLAIVRARSAALVPAYLGWVMQSEGVRSQLSARATGVTRYGLTYEAIQGVELTLVEASRQAEIARFLDAQVAVIEDVIAERQRELELVNRSLLVAAHAAVTGAAAPDRLPTDLPWAGSLPRGWRVGKLSLLARMGSGHTPSRSEPDYWQDCTIPWITTGEVHRFRRDEIETLNDTTLHISDLGLRNSAAVLHPAGTVALCRTAASAGYSVVMGTAMATSQDIVTWTCGPSLNPYYLLWVLRASRRDLLDRLAMGSTHRTIYFPDLEMLRVPLPPLPDQVAAVDVIRRRSEVTNDARQSITRSIALLQERKTSLISACTTGSFDVTTASGRAAEAALGGAR